MQRLFPKTVSIFLFVILYSWNKYSKSKKTTFIPQDHSVYFYSGKYVNFTVSLKHCEDRQMLNSPMS